MPKLVDLGIDHLAPLDVAHLQFDPRTEGQLRGHGLYTIGDLDSGSANYRNIPYSLDDAIEDRLALIAEHTDNLGTKWSEAWRTLSKGPFNFAFSQRPLSHCSECGSISLEILRIRAGRILNIPILEGYTNLRELLNALERTSGLPHGFGKGKMIQLSAVLEHELRECAEHHVTDRSESFANSSNNVPISAPNDELQSLQQKRDEIQSALKTISIDALGLGKKTYHLKQQGWRYVGDLPMNLEKTIYKMPGLGRQTAERAISAKSNLTASCIDGKIDRQVFADLEGMPIIPASRPDSSHSLSDWFRITLINAATYDDNPITSLVVKERVCKAGSNTATLEEIAFMPNVNLTRERVRQIEKRFLNRVRKGLLDPWTREAGCLFTDEFREPFVALADSLSSRESIGIPELVDNIEHFWNCRRREANLLLPMVMAIIEGTARTDGNLRRLGDLPEALLRPLRRPARDWPSWNLGAGKSLTRRMERNSITNAEGLRLAWIDGFDFKDETETLLQGLAYLSELKTNSQPDFDYLSEVMGKKVFPAQPSNPSGYLETIVTDLSTLIDQGDFYSRSKDIFLRRSALPPEERAVSQSLADEYGVTQPTVSRTQTVTLERLSDLILGKLAGCTGMMIRPDWLDFWIELENLFERFYPDQRTFQRSIMTTFDAPEGIVGVAVHPIWAVLSGRTSKRSIGQIDTQKSAESHVMAPVALQGFRTVH